jgi:hypothetical protein
MKLFISNQIYNKTNKKNQNVFRFIRTLLYNQNNIDGGS